MDSSLRILVVDDEPDILETLEYSLGRKGFEVATAADFESQKTLLDRIQEIIVADQPYTFLVENVRLVGLDSRIQNADINDAAIFFNVEDWHIDE